MTKEEQFLLIIYILASRICQSDDKYFSADALLAMGSKRELVLKNVALLTEEISVNDMLQYLFETSYDATMQVH